MGHQLMTPAALMLLEPAVQHFGIHCMLSSQARARRRCSQVITSELLISERLAKIADRAVPGPWEGDLISGLNN